MLDLRAERSEGTQGRSPAAHPEECLGVYNDSDQVSIQNPTEVQVWEGEQRETGVVKKVEDITWGQ